MYKIIFFLTYATTKSKTHTLTTLNFWRDHFGSIFTIWFILNNFRSALYLIPFLPSSSNIFTSLQALIICTCIIPPSEEVSWRDGPHVITKFCMGTFWTFVRTNELEKEKGNAQRCKVLGKAKRGKANYWKFTEKTLYKDDRWK